jgi:thiamine-monophosphate kinase
MKLKEIGEFGFIDRFSPQFGTLLHSSMVGIGDDCAIIPASDTEDWLVTTDLLMEDVHFLRQAITPEQLGHKALAVNLSDIAAMGGTPTGSFLSIAIPADIEVEYLDAFMKGYFELSQKYSTPLLGGDTTKSVKQLAINVCVIGKCPKGTARRRGMAQANDVVCVTGNLGDSAAGLQVLLQQLPPSTNHEYLIDRHHQPKPRLAEGIFLSAIPEVHAMMDISDGVASDLGHILKASTKSTIIHLNQLPLSSTLCQVAQQQQWNAVELAAAGGEDYELLCTVAPEVFEIVNTAFTEQFNRPLTQIGTITDGEPHIRWMSNGSEVSLGNVGFKHF